MPVSNPCAAEQPSAEPSRKRARSAGSVAPFLGVITAWAFTGSAGAAPVPWLGDAVPSKFERRDVTSALKELCSGNAVALVLSPAITGKLSGDFSGSTSRQVFEQVAKAHNLIWHFDGTALYVYPAEEITTHLIQLKHLGAKEGVESLERAQLVEERYPVREMAPGLLQIIAPPRLADLQKETLRAMDEVAFSEGEIITRVFRLKSASAQDVTLGSRKDAPTVPGVATQLQSLWSPAGTAVSGAGKASAPRLLRIPSPESGTHLRPLEPMLDPLSPTPAPVASHTGREEPAAFPIIQAEPRLNAVVIRDYRSRMSRYAELIAELDQPTSLVEISAQIIDVDHEASLDLGIHWSYSQAGRTRFGLGQSAFALGEPQLHYSAMLANQTRQFLFRVRAMEVEGRARVTSRPSVLTANNQEALIEHTQSAHVKVGGTYEASLFEVVAGTVLRVTPKVVSHEGRRAVEMSMNVEDGNFSASRQVDSIPVVNRSALRTQATVLENQSILIGGLSFREEGARSEGVPYLRKIPLLGLAFSAKTRTGKTWERMVLISPRVTQWERPGTAPARRPETSPMTGKPLFRDGR